MLQSLQLKMSNRQDTRTSCLQPFQILSKEKNTQSGKPCLLEEGKSFEKRLQGLCSGKVQILCKKKNRRLHTSLSLTFIHDRLMHEVMRYKMTFSTKIPRLWATSVLLSLSCTVQSHDVFLYKTNFSAHHSFQNNGHERSLRWCYEFGLDFIQR